MDSTRFFLRLWALLLFAVLVYAAIDLGLHPSLQGEVSFTLRPDVGHLPDLMHWGGRLLRHHAIGLLVSNAVIVSGFLSLLVTSAYSALRGGDPEARESLAASRASFPPPRPSFPPST